MDFGDKLKHLRKQSGPTPKQLGDLIEVTISVISFYELQERIPSPTILVKLAAIFHISTDYLLEVEKKRTIDVSDLSKNNIEIIQLIASALRRKNNF